MYIWASKGGERDIHNKAIVISLLIASFPILYSSLPPSAAVLLPVTTYTTSHPHWLSYDRTQPYLPHTILCLSYDITSPYSPHTIQYSNTMCSFSLYYEPTRASTSAKGCGAVQGLVQISRLFTTLHMLQWPVHTCLRTGCGDMSPACVRIYYYYHH